LKITREIKTAVIVLGGIFLFILGFSYLKSNALFNSNRTFYAVYSHVGGLASGTPVTINGFKVGTIQDIRFKDAKGQLLVTFTVDSDFEFSKNSVAELYDTGIIGGKGVQLLPVFDGSAMAQSGDTLPSSIKPGLTELVTQQLTPLQEKIQGAITSADSVLVGVNSVLDNRTKGNLQDAIAGLNDVIKSFKQTSTSLNTMLSDNKESINSSLSNIDKITTNFSKVSDELAAANMGATIKKLQGTVKGLNNVLSKIEKGEGSLGKLMKDEAMYNNLAEASHQLDLLLEDMRLNPKRYVHFSLFGKKQKEYKAPEENQEDK
jgi:phospholipid/cholesterol/gamma-HCH transport system substrate-binding protein